MLLCNYIIHAINGYYIILEYYNFIYLLYVDIKYVVY